MNRSSSPEQGYAGLSWELFMLSRVFAGRIQVDLQAKTKAKSRAVLEALVSERSRLQLKIWRLELCHVQANSLGCFLASRLRAGSENRLEIRKRYTIMTIPGRIRVRFWPAHSDPGNQKARILFLLGEMKTMVRFAYLLDSQDPSKLHISGQHPHLKRSATSPFDRPRS